MLLDYFKRRTWTFNDVNMRRVYQVMSEEDHEHFPVILRAEDYETHAYNSANGIRKYFFKENDDDLKIALRRYKLFNILHNLLIAVIYGNALYFLYAYLLK